MNTIFKLCKKGACGVSITGLEKEDLQYKEENPNNEFSFYETVTVNIMIPLDSKENSGKCEYTIKEHLNYDTDVDETVMEFPKDGLYKIIHMILPTKNWVNTANYDIIYYYNDGNFYNAKDEVIDIETIIETNQEVSTASFSHQLTFSSCRLQDCYYKYASKFLEDYCATGKCYTKNSVEFDIIFVGIHVLKYLLDLNRLFEAQYVLEKLTGCTGVCQQHTKISIKGNGCGC